jgi:hypothetical protein
MWHGVGLSFTKKLLKASYRNLDLTKCQRL